MPAGNQEYGSARRDLNHNILNLLSGIIQPSGDKSGSCGARVPYCPSVLASDISFISSYTAVAPTPLIITKKINLYAHSTP